MFQHSLNQIFTNETEREKNEQVLIRFLFYLLSSIRFYFEEESFNAKQFTYIQTLFLFCFMAMNIEQRACLYSQNH